MNYLRIFGEWSNWAWSLGINHLWQASLFAGLVLAVSMLLRKGPARARYAIWLLASLKFALPSTVLVLFLQGAGIDLRSLFKSTPQASPAFQYLTPVVSPVAIPAGYLATPAHVSEEVRVPNSPAVSEQNRLELAAALVWLSVCSTLLYNWINRRRRVSLAIKSGRILQRGREWRALNKVKLWLGVRRRVDLVLAAGVKEPGVWRVFRPIVLLPEEISGQLSDEELESLMMHEMAHVLRWDNLVSNLNMVLCCVFWFNPIVWLIDSLLLKEREEACDEVVLSWGGAGEIYASSIKKIYRFCLSSRISGLSAVGGSNLRRRLERIVSQSAGSKFSVAHKLLVASTIFGGIMLSLVAGTTARDSVVARTNSALQQAATNLVAHVVSREGKECAEPEMKQCLPRTINSIAAADPLGKVEVQSDSTTLVQSSPSLMALSARAASATANAISSTQSPQPPQLFQSAHAPDLKKFVGRYAIDPGVMENFVLDVSLEAGELWLKPSHTEKHRLVAQSNVEYVDSKVPDTKITFNFDSTGNVESLTLNGWGPTIVALKLVLPPPSVEGNVTFRLSGFPGAHIVAVAGTFNSWNQSQYLFARVGEEWICRLHLPAGKYQYKFIIDGNWLVDPRNPTVVHDNRDFENSVLIVTGNEE